MIGYFEIIISCVTVTVIIYFYNASRHSFWKKKNVKGPKPVPIFGNLMDIILGRISSHEMYRDLYLTWKHEPFFGFYQGTNPVLVVNDPEQIKHILIKDFTTFADRGFIVDEEADPLTANLFMLDGRRWRGLRTRLLPVFTARTLKQMYDLLTDRMDHFGEFIDELLTKRNVIEVMEATAEFTFNVIGWCVFGLNVNTLSSEKNEFKRMAENLFTPNMIGIMKYWLRDLSPALCKFLNIKLLSKEESEFFTNSIAEAITYRKKNNIVRRDFIHLMIQLQENPNGTDFEITDELLIAQAFVFYMVGYETLSTTMSFAFYELAKNKEIQNKLRAEIRDTLKEHNEQLPYGAVKDLKYLDKVFHETLRKHPAITNLIRIAVKNFTLPDSTVKIPVGTKVLIPVRGLHHDPKYFPEPEVFDPERFSEEAIQKRPQMVYLPFGKGPRNCIGARFANYITKLGIIQIIKDYEITLSPEMKIPFKMKKTSLVPSPVNGIHVLFEKLPKR